MAKDLFPHRFRLLTRLFGWFIFYGSLTAGPTDLSDVPQRIILTLTALPSRSQAVTWRTLNDAANPRAQICVASESMRLDKEAKTCRAVTERVLTELGPVSQHSVVFQSLQANTLYAYRVSGDKYWSEWFQFRTACEPFAPFSFVYLGDPQDDIKSMCSRIFRAAYQKAPDAGFWLIAGDLVNHGYVDHEWSEFYEALGWISGMTPMMLVPGNHEYYDKVIKGLKKKRITPLWRAQFTLPGNGPEGLEETAYFVDYQGVRFIVLNGNEALEAQARWMETVLAENTRRWTVVCVHQTVFSVGKNRNNKKLRELFLPLIDRYKVDLVLQGHDHVYARSYKLRNKKRVKEDQSGTVFITSVSGTKVYPINDLFKELMEKTGRGRQLFQVIQVNENHLVFHAFNAMGDLYDSVKIDKY